ncbi:MAG: hypothetical protein ACRDSE_13620 [Pseudonocardiaceae bacterium]
MREPLRASLAAGACALLVGLAGCGADASRGAVAPSQVDSSEVVMERSAAPNELQFGQPHPFADGLTITVSEPESFTPSASAYPQAARAIAFQIMVRNETDRPYRLSGMSITVTANGEPAKEIVDSPQGFNGIAGADNDVPPTRGVLVTLAFAMPSEPAPVRLTVKPDLTDPASAIYVGRA